MESLIIEKAASQGIWAACAVLLLLYIIKAQEKRDAKQDEREKRYQELLENFSKKFELVNNIREDVATIKESLKNN